MQKTNVLVYVSEMRVEIKKEGPDMGEFTVIKWKCDRCGCVEDKRPWLPYKMSMTASADCGVAGGSVSWKELCKDCNEWLGQQFKAMNLRL